MTSGSRRSVIGALIAGVIVFANFAIALPLTGLSYDRFQWTAFAVSYDDATPTCTPTSTPTPTNTPIPNGGSCMVGSECASDICVTGVCCDRACDQPLERCNLPGSRGVCTRAIAPAPALSDGGIAGAVIMLLVIGGLSIGGLSLRAWRTRHRDAV
jgi:hypothetical protein